MSEATIANVMNEIKLVLEARGMLPAGEKTRQEVLQELETAVRAGLTS